MNNTSAKIITQIASDLRAIEANSALCWQSNFQARANAIDFIDFHILERIDGLAPEIRLEAKLIALGQRAQRTKFALEKIDAALFKNLRQKIKTGQFTAACFREMIRENFGIDVHGITGNNLPGYDNLDTFFNGLLSGKAIPETVIEGEPDMVFFQKTPARIILEMVDLAGLTPGDVFFDLGSGLGQAVMLVALTSMAKAKGIEFDPAYCNYAIACASAIKLSNVEFINADARNGDYSEATVFFMYTPFVGSMMLQVLGLLEIESRKKTIRIFSYGPSSSQLARQKWLKCVHGQELSCYELCEFRSIIPEF